MDNMRLEFTQRISVTDTLYVFRFDLPDGGYDREINIFLRHDEYPDKNELEDRAWDGVLAFAAALPDLVQKMRPPR